ncbi:MAG: class I SAM-dependent DNA methyltransferase [Bacteroidaceae bacterium]|nr:class I SAM-dependent DNA methyltransferase [Bacteroidaceae bacterium]
MEYRINKPNQSIAKVYLRERPAAQEMESFRNAMQILLQRINAEESEEFNKNLVTEFFNTSIYRGREYMVNTYQRTDLAIYTQMGTHEEHPVVLFEFKGPSRPDMVTIDDLKKKALYELVLYYIREEVNQQNTDIKHLIITNCWEYFVFEKRLFYQLFVNNKRFLKQVVDADTGDDTKEYIYNAIIKPEVERIEHRLQFTYINLKSFPKKINDESIINDKSFIAAYKLFSPTHLLKLPFYSDHNTLNRDFYSELLYIMGVEEVIDQNNVRKIKRLKDRRQEYSLVEQAYSKLEDYSDIKTDDERFEKALGLILTWVNRLLFLKLLESQLIRFNNDRDARFLDFSHVKDYDVLHDLFMQVMAKPYAKRSEELKRQFPEVPYLNSSLFEMSPLEEKYFAISGIRLGGMDLYSRTVLKNERGRRLTGRKPTLDYLFQFLNAYDFGSEKNEDDTNVRTESKTLINASVLGMIFEKINGYKDGSFYTPGYITEYICNKTIRRAIIDKFNEVKGWNCENYEDLKDKIDYGQRTERNEANLIINSLKICDPAVGSGHFLVSALNEIIAIKRELGVLQDRKPDPKRIREYDIRVEYDELVVADEDGETFKYNPSQSESQRIQETLFEEKRTIIENCLFGVDINPKSVEICRLRLWIELLKNAYYYRTDNGERVLQTLPNIDINIKCGNSLASSFWLNEKLDSSEPIKQYKKAVADYKQTSNKNAKWEIGQKITILKSTISRKLIATDKEPIVLAKLEDRYNELMETFSEDMFGFTKAQIKERKKEIKILKEEIKQKRAKVERRKSNTIFSTLNSFEWRFEFPEVLDDDGQFLGFDCVIGNPPYISLESLKGEVSVYNRMLKPNDSPVYTTIMPHGDIYTLFVERGLYILRQGGHLSYIIPNKWEKVIYGKPLRGLFLEKNLTHLIDFCDNQLFEDATTYTCIIRMKNEESKRRIQISTLQNLRKEMLFEDVEEQKETFNTSEMDDDIWVISSLQHFKDVYRLKHEMTPLGFYVGRASYRGILSGLSAAFNISTDKAYALISQDKISANILRPFLQGRGLVAYGEATPGSYLVFIPKGFTALKMGIDRKKHPLPSEDVAWKWFQTNYQAVAEWLVQFEQEARLRQDKGDYWWELRGCAYYDKFELPKIFYQVFQTKPCFIYDESSFFCNNSMYFITVPDKALLALLCSKIGWWLISEFCPRIQNGFQLIWDNFSSIPIPKELPDELGHLADQLMQSRNDDTRFKELSNEVDRIVCDLYGIWNIYKTMSNE